jgi:hypothetical protein
MADMPWNLALERVQPNVVRISTPRGSGTGFLISHGKNIGLCAVATAAHVIDVAHYWEEPIRTDHHESKTSVLLRELARSIHIHDDDTAAVVFNPDQLKFSVPTLPLLSKDLVLRVGNDIGWLGFPAVAASSLCFFGGRISAWLEKEDAYLVDGVAINGVSGGPAFVVERDEVTIMGVVSAYAPNRATGETLPGLAIIRSVATLNKVVEDFTSFDQAKAQETPPSAAGAAEATTEGSTDTRRAT